ncbi:MAG: phosphoribosyltransferase [Cyanobacteria bacterium P01_F01_bin.150]
MSAPPIDKFNNRRDAGQQLASRLNSYGDCSDAIVLALPRGGVPVGYEIAIALHIPLDVCLVRKLGVPTQPELAMGAIAPGNICLLNHVLIQKLRISRAAIATVQKQEKAELARRQQAYRLPNVPMPTLAGKTVILVDDGIATGSTFRAAIATVERHSPRQIIAAIPVASPSACQELSALVDRVECLIEPPDLMAIGRWYKDFSQTSDDEVRSLLQSACEQGS